MFYDTDDTIAAISTAAGGAARGMVRVSGPATSQIVAKCFEKKGTQLFFEKSCVPFCVGGSLEVTLSSQRRRIPCDLFFWPTDRSYTREPVAEFHTPGSEPLLRAVLDSICCAGARLAEPGEFTLRAFMSGRIDLTQAEAVLGVIDAKQQNQLHTALIQLAGGLARPLDRLRSELLQLLAELEAGLDFVDEDVEFITTRELIDRLQIAGGEIRRVAAQMESRLTEPATGRVVLLGPPNVGKSSLFNAMLARFGSAGLSSSTDGLAIVSNEQGTTRDYLTAIIDLDGCRCELVDTAGLEPHTIARNDSLITRRVAIRQSPAAAAQAQSAQVSAQASVRAWCVDSTSITTAAWPAVDVVVGTKADLAPQRPHPFAARSISAPVVVTSSVTGQGLDALRRLIASMLVGGPNDRQAGVVAATADRCRDSLRLADSAISRAADAAIGDHGDELVAAELRVALAELGQVVGAVCTEDILDRIFKTFCIGK